MKIICLVIWMSGVLLMLPRSTHSQFKTEAIMCGKIPLIPDISNCERPAPNPTGINTGSIDGLHFQAILLPFDDPEALWLHVHVWLDLHLRHDFENVALMAQNILGYPVGEWIEELPCEIYQPGVSAWIPGIEIDEYELISEKAETFRIVACPKTPYGDRPPNFLSKKLKDHHLSSFYATLKLSKLELANVVDYGNTVGLSGIRFVVAYTTTPDSVCHLNHHSEFFVIKEKSFANCDRVKNFKVPVECHRCAQANIVVKADDENANGSIAQSMPLDYINEMEFNPATPRKPKRPSYPGNYSDPIIRYLDTDKTKVVTSNTTTETTTEPIVVNTKTPTSSMNTTTPASSMNTTTPASSMNTTTPASSMNTTTPASSMNTTTPVPPMVVNTKPTELSSTSPTANSSRERSGSSPDIEDNTAMVLKEIPKNVYNDCGRTKGCIGEPPGCLAAKICESFVSYSGEGDKAAFQLYGKSDKYVAMGFSKDRLMGHDSVIECVRESGDAIRAYRSYNTMNKDNKRLKDHSPISRIKGKYQNGEIYCEFLYHKRTIVHHEKEKETYDLEKEAYYVLYADGPVAQDGLDGNVGYHSESFVGDRKLHLLRTTGKSPGQLVFEKIHGMIMIIVWICIYPVSTFLPRYFKETWIDVFIKTYTWWYFIHIILTGLTVFLTVFATFGLTIALHGSGEYPWVDGFHMIAGFIINALIIFDVFLGYVVVKFNINFRYYSINFMHGFIGHIVFFLSYVTIFLSRNIPGGMPCISTNSMIAFLFVVLVIHLGMNFQVWYTDFVQGRYVSRVYYSCGTLDLPGKTLEKEAPDSLCRKVVLVVFVVICLTFTVILCVLYGHSMYLNCEEDRRTRATADTDALQDTDLTFFV